MDYLSSACSFVIHLEQAQLILVRQIIQDVVGGEEAWPIFTILENSGFPACL